MRADVITNPTPNWLERLRKGNWVWLVKEQRLASVVYAYEPPEPGYGYGKIGILNGHEQDWFINTDGKGFDGLFLMLPIDGELSDNPAPLEEPAIVHLRRAIERLNKRVEKLESRQLLWWV